MKVDDLDVVAAADRGLLEEWAVGLDALGELIGPRFFRREPRVRALAYEQPRVFRTGFLLVLCYFLAVQPSVVNFLRCAVSES